jgi:hypothetical protein
MTRPNRIVCAGNLLVMVLASAGLAACLMVAAAGGTNARAQAPAAGQSAASSAAFTPKVAGTLLQIMRGVMFPESNVVFAGQNDVSKIPQTKQAEISTDLLTSAFGGWQAVENSALGLAESSNLLVVPGRTCANGKPVPVGDAAWVKYVNGMRDAAMNAYKAAQAKSTDDMVDAAGEVSEACMACHNTYRSNRAGMDGRCTFTPPRTVDNPPASIFSK